ncbi:filamentous haemagglutinin family protein [Pinirhizobacter soli]|uniref:filamentous haemagglutinin family protein n=1 Tax=Pinirhizobacter soli TaxID=2786953 RepID=UPI00202A9961|nr:filamentous haemagglutinin family protein [Pinirhizobacter soli]
MSARASNLPANRRPALRRRALAQLITLALAAGSMSAHAAGPQAFSSAWLAQKGQPGTSNNVTTPGTGGANTGGALTPGNALLQKNVQQSITNLNNAAQAVAAQMAAQQAAATLASKAPSNIPNGLAIGGLAPAAGIATDPTLWQNANAPTQSVANGQTTVEVKQTAAKAILNWDSFNVGRDTTLYFNQSAGNQTSGGNQWIVLNRIAAGDSPSQILGHVKAEGTVYLLNRNGFLFGGGSTVNTHSLLVSSLDLFSSDTATSNQTFLNEGLAATPNGAGRIGMLVSNFTDGQKHDVVIEKGASLNAGAQGFALVAAPNVSNAGQVVTDDGQAILVASTNVGSTGATGPLDVFASALTSVGLDYAANRGTALNTGLVQARRGGVQVLGYNVDQEGVVLASTSISHPGSIELRAQDSKGNTTAGASAYPRSGNLTLGNGSVTTILPEKDGTTTSSSPNADKVFVNGTVTLAGGTVTFAGGSLLEAPAATLDVTAIRDAAADPALLPSTAGRVYLDDGAVIDVSGLANVVLPISALLVDIPRIGQNELANSPLLRNSFLYTQKDILIDSSQSGTRADGLDWVGSPILNVSGYVDNVPRDISQMLTQGGSVNLNGNEVIVRSGAQLKLDGGYLAYQAGWIDTPNLLGADGRIYNIATADPQMDYVGFAGQYSINHPRWGVTQTYNSPILAGARRWDDGFISGSAAGNLTIQADDALVLDGDISAIAYVGRNQIVNGTPPAPGALEIGVMPASVTRRADVAGIRLQQSSLVLDELAPGFSADTPWDVALTAQDATANASDNLRDWLIVPTDAIARAGFGSVSVVNTGQIVEASGTVLAVAPGGSINLQGSRIDVLGTLSAPSGQIQLTTTGPNAAAGSTNTDLQLGADITLGDGALVSTRGLWLNDSGASPDALQGDHYINGGSVSLTTNQAYSGDSNNLVDGTGSIVLQSGSTIDVSSGGYVGPDGLVRTGNGVPEGRGGDVSLVTYGGKQLYGIETGSPTSLHGGRIDMDGSILGYGFSGGGNFTLQAPSIQIGGDPNSRLTPDTLYLDAGFFAGNGFDNYALTAIADATIAAGTTVQVQRDNFLPDLDALRTAPTGTDLYAIDAEHPAGTYATIGSLDAFHRWATRDIADGRGPGFSLSTGSYLTWFRIPQTLQAGPPVYAGLTGALLMDEGASINVDAGGSVNLSSVRSVTVLGDVTAHGGDIDVSTLSPGLVRQAAIGEVWLGSNASLDASGVTLIDPLASSVRDSSYGAPLFTPRTGAVLAGGSVSLTGQNGYVLASQGSRIDVSGTADQFDLPVASQLFAGDSQGYLRSPVWSDAGSITLAATTGLDVDSTLVAHGGAPLAEGGSLTVEALPAGVPGLSGPAGILVRQSGNTLDPTLMPGDVVEAGGPSGIVNFVADSLHSSGITSLDLDSQKVIGFAGDVDIDVGRAFTAEALSLVALPVQSTSLTTAAGSYALGNGTVHIRAPYASFTGGNNVSGDSPAARAGDGNLVVDADFIDIGDSLNLQQWANTTFNASGDIRFDSALPAVNGVIPTGLLFTTGDLTFKAAQLYPATNYRFVIDANASGVADANGNARETTVTFLPNGVSDAPLSAGGALLVSADHIEQEGSIKVPAGILVLGVKDPSADAAAFGLDLSKFPLVATKSVHLADGSLTSVSLDGATVPFGTTVDGTEWRYNVAAGTNSADLTAPPSGQITIGGTALALDKGAGIDLSGGGKLQAQEWVPGTGGTRDVLAQYSTDFTQGNGSGTAVPQYADGRAVYAIVPGYHGPVAAHDASIEANGNTPPLLGQAIYLSGVPGLPDGVYTLLPSGYATLPGAFRVVQDTGASAGVAGRTAIQPDGTISAVGYMADALSGARSAQTSTFLLQGGPVWQQYSQYTLSDADTFFDNLASKAGNVAPPTPRDAARLVLSAGKTLDLGATLTAQPADGGRSSQVDIAALAIQVLGDGETARDGYLQLSADGLTQLGAGSLLLGGTRSTADDGDHITSVADSVVVSNDAAHPLAGQEIMLVARGTTDSGAEGVLVESGGVIQARGDGNASSTHPLVFGSDPSVDANGAIIPGISGDGSMLRVSQNGAATTTRYQVPGMDGVAGTSQGRLTIDAGANIDGGSALTLDATGATVVDPTATFTAKAIDANSNLITFVGNDAVTGLGGLVIGPQTLNLFRDADSVTLRSRGAIDFVGNVDVSLDNSLELSAPVLASDGGQVTVEAGTLRLGNTLGSQDGNFAAGSGGFTAQANEIDFGPGNTTLQGFGSFVATANQGMVGQGTGGVDFGNLDVHLQTPILMADSGSDTSLTTTGTMTIASGAGTALQRDAMGGALALQAGNLAIGSNLQAAAGNLDLTATSGNIDLLAGSRVDTAGVNKTFFDTQTYAPGGALTITANHGNVNLQQGASLDFAGAAQGGDAGSLSVTAEGSATLDGQIDGHAGDGYRGGYFSLASGTAVDLDNIAALATNAGLTGMVSVTSGAGNLQLSAGHDLVAQKVYLTANGGTVPSATGGNVIIDGTIDASAPSGSYIELYGKSGVDIEGTLRATSSIAAQRGGDVVIDTDGVANGSLNATYGYENVDATGSGFIHLGANALVDVSGGSSDPSTGGHVSFRAPLLADGDVRIAIDGGGKAIAGARQVDIEPFAVWSTKDAYDATDPASAGKHFDGVIDPSGWYAAGGTGAPALVAGKWVDASGTVLDAPSDDAQLKQYLTNDYFMPDTANADHQTFYGYVAGDASKGPGTLMGFVEQPGFSFGDRFSGIANAAVRPGIELRNPLDGSNGGTISVLTNWNLGAGVTGTDGTITLAYRYQGQAPILTVRAANDLDIQASITDGFYQQNDGAVLADPPAPPPPVNDNGYSDAVAAYQATQQYLDDNSIWNGTVNLKNGTVAAGMTPGGPTISITSDPYYQPLQAPLQNQSANYYANYEGYIGEYGDADNPKWAAQFALINNFTQRHFLAYNPTTLIAPQPAAYSSYADYVADYQSWLTANFALNPVAKRASTPSPLLLPIDADYGLYTADYSQYITGHAAYYTYVSTKVGNTSAGSQLFYAPFAPKANAANDNPAYDAALAAYQTTQQYLDDNSIWNGTVNLKNGTVANGMTPGGPTIDITSDPYYQPLQAPLQNQSANYYTNYEGYIGEYGDADNPKWAAQFALINNFSQRRFLAYNPTSLVAPQPAAYDSYADYVTAYQSWLTANFALSPVAKRASTPSPLLLPIDGDYGIYTADYSQYITGHAAYYTYVSTKVGNTSSGSQLFYAPFAPKDDPASAGGGGDPTTVPVPASAADNSPSNMPRLGSPASLASATLMDGPSSSYRLVAGADMDAVNPLAVSSDGVGDVTLDGHFAVVDSLTDPSVVTTTSPYAGKTLVFPTTVRTGTGSIEVAAGNDIQWLDQTAPADIYTAGTPVAGTSAGTGVAVIRPSELDPASVNVPDMLVTGLVNPDHAGDISLSAGGDINSIANAIDTDGSITKGTKGSSIEQFWWPWMQTGNAADGSSSSINFGNFAQGVMSVGGNVSVDAGGDIRQLAVSLPTTWIANADRTAITTIGRGNLQVHAGGDILSGNYFVSKGTADIEAGGQIAADYNFTANFGPGGSSLTTPVSTILGIQDAQVDVRARLGADLGGVFNPSYYTQPDFLFLLPATHVDTQALGSDSSLVVTSTGGNVALGSTSVPGALFSLGADLSGITSPVLPSTVELSALSGDINILSAGELYPSATGNLQLLADGSIQFSRQTVFDRSQPQSTSFGLIDTPPGEMPSPLSTSQSSSYISTVVSSTVQTPPLARTDNTPVRIYALNGDIVDGITAPNGFNFVSLVLYPAKQALVYAGRDIANLSFVGQHLHDADVTRIAAGRDIYDTALTAAPWDLFIPDGYELVPSLLLGGPGNFLVEAGRNIGPLANETEITSSSVNMAGNLTGIQAIGNLYQAALPHESADVNVAFGVGPGVATQDFIARYVDNANQADGLGDATADLVAFMEQRVAGQVVDTGLVADKKQVTLSPEQARALFDAQPEYVQRLFAEKELFKFLAVVGSDYNNASSPFFNKYQRGYAAIDTLFPASYGYTANGAGQGGLNGAAQTVDTGDLDIRGSTIQTQQGGDVTVVGPGGQALLGSTSAPSQIVDGGGNVLAGPNTMGVLTLEQGNINMFTDRSVLLAQSRIFTEQGGDLVMWSSNGDINAGQGAKTSSEIPPPTYQCTLEAWCRIDARGEVSGAGIATLQTVAGGPEGDVFLIAPRGTVDAGDAGIRVAGNLVIAAARVANADNIQVKGEAIGVPVTAQVNVGALNAANAAASAASKVAEDVARKQQDDARDRMPSIISVQVLSQGNNGASVDSGSDKHAYDPDSPVQVIGAGRLSARRQSSLTQAERSRLAE